MATKKVRHNRTLEAGEEGIEPPLTVLETAALPLYYSPLLSFVKTTDKGNYSTMFVPYASINYIFFTLLLVELFGNIIIILTICGTYQMCTQFLSFWIIGCNMTVELIGSLCTIGIDAVLLMTGDLCGHQLRSRYIRQGDTGEQDIRYY